MCYLIAKDRESHGCLAFKTTHGKHLVELKRKLNRAVGYKGVQLVTISRPTAYGEYAPYQFVDTEQEFEKALKRCVHRILLVNCKSYPSCHNI